MELLFLIVGILAVSILLFFGFCLVTVLVSARDKWAPVYDDELRRLNIKRSKNKDCKIVKIPAKVASAGK